MPFKLPVLLSKTSQIPAYIPDTAPSVAEAEHARKSPFHQVYYNYHRLPSWGEANLLFPGIPFISFVKFLN